MFIAAVENFILFSALLALFCFALAWAARRACEKDRWRPHPHTLARFYSAMLIAPPVIACWLVAASILPERLIGESAFKTAHPAPLHQLHLLGELTATLEPAFAYLTLSFAAAVALFAAWSSARGYLRVGRVIERLEMNVAPPPPE